MLRSGSVCPSLVSSSSPVSFQRGPAKVAAGKAVTSVAPNLARSDFPMCKKFLRSAQKVVEDAQAIARLMLEREARCPGDLPEAMGRLERRHGLPSRTFWTLRYRPPKRMFADVYLQLKAAYQAECERQQKALENEIAFTAATAGADHILVRATAALVGADVSAQEMTARRAAAP